MPLEKIISGGQSGADRGALDAALDAGFPCGGHCPRGRLAEDGPVPDRYPLIEMASGSYRERTRRNVADADGTLILTDGALAGGTLHTMKDGRTLDRPLLMLDLKSTDVAGAIAASREFVDDNDVTTLNVAGPRASESPEIYEFTYAVIAGLIQAQRQT